MMKWFEKHVNWTWVFGWLLMQVIIYISYLLASPWDMTSVSGAIIIWMCVVVNTFSVILWLVISGWVIKQKGESLWWLLLSVWWSPVWLANIKTIVKERMASLQDK
jgi:hypothetical protein